MEPMNAILNRLKVAGAEQEILNSALLYVILSSRKLREAGSC
jgi:hypothetical protein